MKKASASSIQGIFPPIPTPFTSQGGVDLENLRRNMERWNRSPLDGYVVMGSNGEFVFLQETEKIALVAAVRASAPPDRLVIAGSGMESTAGTIDLTAKLAEAGADLALVITPNYYLNQMVPQVLEEYYQAVATASPIPIILYNMPAYTGVDMPNELILELARHPNIVGIKESSGHMIKAQEIIRQAPARFRYLTGTANHFLEALTLGATGGIMALANIAAGPLYDLQSALHSKATDRAHEIQQRLIPANLAITTRYGVAGLKAAMDLLGYYGGPPRLPLRPLRPGSRADLRAILNSAGLV